MWEEFSNPNGSVSECLKWGIVAVGTLPVSQVTSHTTATPKPEWTPHAGFQTFIFRLCISLSGQTLHTTRQTRLYHFGSLGSTKWKKPLRSYRLRSRHLACVKILLSVRRHCVTDALDNLRQLARSNCRTVDAETRCWREVTKVMLLRQHHVSHCFRWSVWYSMIH